MMARRSLAGLLLGVLGWPLSGQAAVTVQSGASHAESAATNSVSWSHTVPSGANQVLAVCVVQRAATANVQANTVTFGAANFAKLRADERNSGVGAFFRTEIWFLVNPTVSTNTITITASGTSTYLTGNAVTYAGVRQSPPFDSNTGATGNDVHVAAVITTTVADTMLMDCASGQADPTLTADGGQTERIKYVTTASADMVGVSTFSQATAGTRTMGWTQASTGQFAISVAALVPDTTTAPATVGPTFTGTCNTITWRTNIEPDLAGYRFYDRAAASLPRTKIKDVGVQNGSLACSQFSFNPGQHYLSIASYDVTGNESAQSADVPFFLNAPANSVTNLTVSVVNATDVTLRFTEPSCAGGSCKYDVRFGTPVVSWGSAASVSSGTCSTPVVGGGPGLLKTCTVTGLSTTTPYQFQLVPYSGDLGVNAAFLPLSNIAAATTGGSGGATNRVTLASDGFDAPDGSLGPDWVGGYVRGGGTLGTLKKESGKAEAAFASTYSAMANTEAQLPAGQQWAQITIGTWSGANFAHIRILLSCDPPSAYTCYEFTIAKNSGGFTSAIRRYVNGSDAFNISESSTTFAAGDVILAEVQGGALTLSKNGAAFNSTVDPETPLTGRYGGLFMGVTIPDAVTTTQVSDITFGTYATPAGSDPCGC